MRSADSCAVSPRTSIFLHMLDWFVENREDRIREAIAAAVPEDCDGLNVEAIGYGVLRQWPDWQQDFWAFVKQDPFARRFFDKKILKVDFANDSAACRGDADELAGRVGLRARSWADGHRRRIEKNRANLRKVKQVQEA